MRCPVCGQRLADGAKCCPSCGAKVEGQLVEENEEAYSGGGVYDPEPMTAGSAGDAAPYAGTGRDGMDPHANMNGADRGTAYGSEAWENPSRPETGSHQSYTTYERPYSHQPDRPMKWYKFLIYVSLLLSGLSNVYSGIMAVIGMHYGDAETADYVYGMYSGLRIVDVIYGVILIASGIYAFYVRQKLAHYRKGAPMHLLILYAVAFVTNLVYVAGASLATGMNLMSMDIVVTLVISIFMIVANKVYFDKRDYMFNT